MVEQSVVASATRTRARVLKGMRAFSLSLGLVLLTAGSVSAQYFGRNKVQYDDFDWQVMSTAQREQLSAQRSEELV